MSKTVKWLLIVVPVVLILVVIIGAVGVWYVMGQPLYRPGMVRAGQDLRGPLAPPAQGDDRSRWRVEEDIELHHFSHGAGPPILFVHGGPGFPARGLPAGLADLTTEYEIHFYDQRGSGRSTKPFDRFPEPDFYANMMELDRTLGIAAQIADIERIRRILGQDKLILMGHSFGGFIAALYAAEFPERIEAMVLLAPADMIIFPAERDGIFEEVRRRLPDGMKDEFDQWQGEYLDFSSVFSKSEAELAACHRKFAEYYLRAVGQDPAPALKELEEAANGGWAVTATYLSLGWRHDYRSALQAVDAPVLVIHGERDLQPVSAGQAYVDVFANADLHVMPEAGHFLLEDRPVELADKIKGFLEGLQAGG
jgi:proline iminopeptidase